MRSTASRRDLPESAVRRLLLAARAHPTASLCVIILAAAAVYGSYVLFHHSEGAELSAIAKLVAQDVVAADVDAVMEHVSPYFFQDGLDRNALRGGLEHALRRRPLSRVVVVVQQLRIRGARARVLLQVDSTPSARGGRVARSQWTVDLEKLDEKWLLRAAAPLTIDGARAAGLRGMLTMMYF